MDQSYDYEDGDIRLRLRIENESEVREAQELRLDAAKVYKSIIDSPWVGNTPLSQCLKPGESFDWEFRYADGLWVKWELQIKTKAKKAYLKMLRNAVEQAIRKGRE